MSEQIYKRLTNGRECDRINIRKIKRYYMKNLQNLHTHSRFCDGENTVEEMILAAIDKGFDSIGFSGHSYMFYTAPDHSMSIEGTEEYKREVRRLAKVYRDKIDVFCGLEFDMYSQIDLSGYDYIIGSVHYLKIGDEYVGFDRAASVVKGVIDKYFDGDGMRYAKAFYATVPQLPKYGKIDVLGHFDLITKHCENENFFDPTSPEYLKYAKEAIDSLVGKVPFFEVNTGAIARNYRTTPYPSLELMKEFKERGFGAVISSDCHNASYLDIAFEDAAEMLRSCGFTERYILTKNGFKAVPLG